MTSVNRSQTGVTTTSSALAGVAEKLLAMANVSGSKSVVVQPSSLYFLFDCAEGLDFGTPNDHDIFRFRISSHLKNREDTPKVFGVVDASGKYSSLVNVLSDAFVDRLYPQAHARTH